MTDRNTLLTFAEVGRLKRPQPSQSDVDPIDVLYAISDEPTYALQILLCAYKQGQDATGFTVGDVVQVKPEHWYRGREYGWHGYDILFAQETGVICEVSVRPSDGLWFVGVQYPYKLRWYSTSLREDKVAISFDPDKKPWFMMTPNMIEKVLVP